MVVVPKAPLVDAPGYRTTGFSLFVILKSEGFDPLDDVPVPEACQSSYDLPSIPWTPG